MAGSHAFEAAAARADVRGKRPRSWLKALTKDQRVRSYRALFVNAAGELRPEAIEMLADLSEEARLGLVPPPGCTDGELRERVGAQRIVLHLIERLDLSGRTLRSVAVELRENEK